MATYIVIFTPGGLLSNLSIYTRVIFTAATLAIFLLWSWYGLARVLVTAYQRGWPLLPIHVAFYLPLAAATAFAHEILGGQRIEFLNIIWNFSALAGLITISASLGMLLYLSFAPTDTRLPLDPKQILWFREKQHCGMQIHLPYGKRGEVLTMQAESQYINVKTPKGVSLLRMSLSEASALVPPNSGLRIHRSHWVNKRLMESVYFDSGNPKLQLKDGSLLPVSRKTVAPLRKLLQKSTGEAAPNTKGQN